MSQSHEFGILFVTPLPPPYGGIATWSETIRRRGLPKPFACRFVDTSIDDSRVLFERASLSSAEITRNLRILMQLARALLLQNVRLVHLNCSLSPRGILRDWISGLLVRIMGKSLVVNFRGNVADFPLYGWFGVRAFLLKNLSQLASVNLVLNRQSQDRLHELAPAGLVCRLPNFIEVDESDCGFELRDRSPESLKVLFVGGLTVGKGIAELMEIPKRFPDLQFYYVGEPAGEVEPEIRALRTLRNVYLTGALNNTEVRDLMRECDIYLFPSHTEGFPVSVVEAMVHGLPVVASSVGAIPDMIEEGKGGLLIDPGDLPAFENALDVLRKDPELRFSMGSFNASKALSQYEFSVVVRQLCDLYKVAVKDSKAQPL